MALVLEQRQGAPGRGGGQPDVVHDGADAADGGHGEPDQPLPARRPAAAVALVGRRQRSRRQVVEGPENGARHAASHGPVLHHRHRARYVLPAPHFSLQDAPTRSCKRGTLISRASPYSA